MSRQVSSGRAGKSRVLLATTLTVAFLGAAALAGCAGPIGGLSDGAQPESGPAATSLAGAQLDPSKRLNPTFVTSTGGVSSYKVGPQDVLKVQVFQVDDLNREVQVAGNGVITLPLIGEVKAAGRTQQQIETEVAARLKARYLQSPQVTVFVQQYNSQKITVSGAVKEPGVFPIMEQMSLVKAIATAKGFDQVADSENIIVFREQNGQRYVGRFDANAINAGSAGDPMLQNGDIVVVERSGFKAALRDWSPAVGFLTSSATFIGLAK